MCSLSLHTHNLEYYYESKKNQKNLPAKPLYIDRLYPFCTFLNRQWACRDNFFTIQQIPITTYWSSFSKRYIDNIAEERAYIQLHLRDRRICIIKPKDLLKRLQIDSQTLLEKISQNIFYGVFKQRGAGAKELHTVFVRRLNTGNKFVLTGRPFTRLKNDLLKINIELLGIQKLRKNTSLSKKELYSALEKGDYLAYQLLREQKLMWYVLCYQSPQQLVPQDESCTITRELNSKKTIR